MNLSPEERQRRSDQIKATKPWLYTSGPITDEGKARVTANLDTEAAKLGREARSLALKALKLEKERKAAEKRAEQQAKPSSKPPKAKRVKGVYIYDINDLIAFVAADIAKLQ